MERSLRSLLFAVALFPLVLSPLRASGFCLPGPVFRPLPPPSRLRCGLPFCALSSAVSYLKSHVSEFPNRRFITIIDYTEPSTSERLFVVDLACGTITKLLVSHGKNSGELFATRFSNRPESLETPRGFFMTGPEYYGPHGPSMVLYGLQPGVNDNSLSRKIVMHGAYYVSWDAIDLNRRLHGVPRLGLSEGCPAIPMQSAEAVIDKIKDGSLLYVYPGPAGG